MPLAHVVLLALAQTTWDLGWGGMRAEIHPAAHANELAVRCRHPMARNLAIQWPGCPDWTLGRLTLSSSQDRDLSLYLDTQVTLKGTLSLDGSTIAWSRAPIMTWRRVSRSLPPITISPELHVVDTRHGKMISQPMIYGWAKRSHFMGSGLNTRCHCFAKF